MGFSSMLKPVFITTYGDVSIQGVAISCETYYVYSISFENIHKSNFCFQKHILSQLLRLPDHLENSLHILKLHSAAFNIDAI